MTSAQVVAVQFGLLRVGQQVGGVIKMAGPYLTTQCVKCDQCASSSSAVWVAAGGPAGRRCNIMAGLFLTTQCVERDKCASSSSAVWVAAGGPTGRRRDKNGRALSNNTVCRT